MSATDTDRRTSTGFPIGLAHEIRDELNELHDRLDQLQGQAESNGAMLTTLLEFTEEASDAIDTINQLGGGSPMAMISGLMRAVRDAPDPDDDPEG